MLDMLARGPARLAVKGQEDEAPRIETRQQRDEGADPEGDLAAAARGIGRLENAVLRIEAGKAEHARDSTAVDRQRPRHHPPIAKRALFPPLPIIAQTRKSA